MLSHLRRCRYSTLDIGLGFTRKIYLLDSAKNKISFWNSIPLKPEDSSYDSDVFNAVIEIPKWNIAKMELNKEEKLHPITQDTRKNKFDKSKTELRYYAQFPLFNYGFFPQTWENSILTHSDIENLSGDGDPLDLIEISDETLNIGSIHKVKVLGTLCLIDEGEVDWKVICTNVDFAKKHKYQECC